eukprot:3733130-Rhodomonas_salina.1
MRRCWWRTRSCSARRRCCRCARCSSSLLLLFPSRSASVLAQEERASLSKLLEQAKDFENVSRPHSSSSIKRELDIMQAQLKLTCQVTCPHHPLSRTGLRNTCTRTGLGTLVLRCAAAFCTEVRWGWYKQEIITLRKAVATKDQQINTLKKTAAREAGALVATAQQAVLTSRDTLEHNAAIESENQKLRSHSTTLRNQIRETAFLVQILLKMRFLVLDFRVYPIRASCCANSSTCYEIPSICYEADEMSGICYEKTGVRNEQS